MRRDLFQAILAAAGATSFAHPNKMMIEVVEKPQYTKNVFGPIDEIVGKKLESISVNPAGDHLCVFIGSKGKNLVDVDHRDIKPVSASQK